MAEIQQGSGGKNNHSKGPQQKRKSTRVDMTAMVDVAFLLLTFFILTTTMTKQNAMGVILPIDGPTNQPVNADKVMTLVLGDRDSIYYYVGVENPVFATTSFSPEGLRKVLFDFIHKGEKEGKPLCENGMKNCWDPIFVIKPAKSSRFENVVDILDEMRIVNAPKYALTNVNTNDSLMMIAQGKE
jgi:biopolymer transport protein ExbD